MKRALALPAVVLLLGTVACSDPQVVAEAAIAQEDTGERLALQGLPIRLLPYDRDAIFDSLEAAHPTPEPPIPPDLLQQQQAVNEARELHSVAEARWGALGDSLRTLSEQTQQMQRQGLRETAQYRQALEALSRLEEEAGRVKLESDSAFVRFAALQRATRALADSIRVARDSWAGEAFRDFQKVVDARLETTGQVEFADTTGAAGVAVFRVPEGQWWVYARYTLPFEELYWNEPIEVAGDSTYILLSEENADRRPAL